MNVTKKLFFPVVILIILNGSIFAMEWLKKAEEPRRELEEAARYIKSLKKSTQETQENKSNNPRHTEFVEYLKNYNIDDATINEVAKPFENFQNSTPCIQHNPSFI